MSSIDVVAVTHRGRERRHNDDTIAVAGYQSGALEGRPVGFRADTVRPVTCLVADGLGGHPEGGRASRIAAATITDASTTFHGPQAVVAAVCAANDQVYAEMAHSPRWNAMGTTIVVLVFSAGEVYCVNVGDSRCFLLRGPDLVQLSADDSPAPAVGGTTVSTLVTQTLGGRPSPEPVTPHVYLTKVEPGDRFLLCSDGLTDEVPPDRIERELQDASLYGGVEALLRAALDAGGRDNVSILLAEYHEDTEEGPDR